MTGKMCAKENKKIKKEVCMKKRKWIKPIIRIFEVDEDVVTLSGSALEQDDFFSGGLNF